MTSNQKTYINVKTSNSNEWRQMSCLVYQKEFIENQENEQNQFVWNFVLYFTTFDSDSWFCNRTSRKSQNIKKTIQTIDASRFSWFDSVRDFGRTILLRNFVVRCGAESFSYGLHRWAPCPRRSEVSGFVDAIELLQGALCWLTYREDIICWWSLLFFSFL